MSRPILPILLACSLACAALTGCTDNEPTCGLAPIYESASGALLSMDPCLGTLALGTEEEPEQWLPIVPLGRSAIASAHDEIEVSMTQGRYVFEGSFDRWAGPTDGRFDGPGRWTGTVDGAETSLQVGPGPRGSIHLHLEVAGDLRTLAAITRAAARATPRRCAASIGTWRRRRSTRTWRRASLATPWLATPWRRRRGSTPTTGCRAKR